MRTTTEIKFYKGYSNIPKGEYFYLKEFMADRQAIIPRKNESVIILSTQYVVLDIATEYAPHGGVVVHVITKPYSH